METLNVEVINPEDAVGVVSNGGLLIDAKGRLGFAPNNWGMNPEHEGKREFYPLDGDGPSVFVPIRY